jgi:hypothetical protein
MRPSILLTTPILAAVIAGCSSTGATPSAASSSTTAAATAVPTSPEGAACAKLGSQPWKIDSAGSHTTEDWLRGFWTALPSHGKLTGDLVGAEADLVMIDGDTGAWTPDAATYTKGVNLLKGDVRKLEADCQAAGVAISVKLSPQPTS